MIRCREVAQLLAFDAQALPAGSVEALQRKPCHRVVGLAGDRALLVDFEHPERNDWLVVAPASW